MNICTLLHYVSLSKNECSTQNTCSPINGNLGGGVLASDSTFMCPTITLLWLPLKLIDASVIIIILLILSSPPSAATTLS